jgi:MinD-like ATPase involved in chromosome partitioning or flagellar assembly
MMLLNETEDLRGVPDCGVKAHHIDKAAVPRIIVVNSGEYADERSDVSFNLATVFTQMGSRVLLLYTGLTEVGFNASSGAVLTYNLRHFFTGDKPLEEVIPDGGKDAMMLSVSSYGLLTTNLRTDEKLALLARLEELACGFNIVLIDTGMDIYDNKLFYNMLAEDIITVVRPYTESIKDVYAFISTVAAFYSKKTFKLMVDSAVSMEEGFEVYRRLGADTDRLTNVTLKYLGCVIFNSAAQKEAMAESNPYSASSKCYRDIITKLSSYQKKRCLNGGIQLFWREKY